MLAAKEIINQVYEMQGRTAQKETMGSVLLSRERYSDWRGGDDVMREILSGSADLEPGIIFGNEAEGEDVIGNVDEFFPMDVEHG